MSEKYLGEKEAKEFEALKIKIIGELLLPQYPREKDVEEFLDLADRFLSITNAS